MHKFKRKKYEYILKYVSFHTKSFRSRLPLANSLIASNLFSFLVTLIGSANTDQFRRRNNHNTARVMSSVISYSIQLVGACLRILTKHTATGVTLWIAASLYRQIMGKRRPCGGGASRE